MTDRTSLRPPGAAQRFANKAGGPAGIAGLGYQVDVACWEALLLLARSQVSPVAVLRLRCEPRALVDGGQFGFDLGVVTPEIDRQLEIKSAPVEAEIVELLARLKPLADQGRSVQLVHAKTTGWTEALDALVRIAGEAMDNAELSEIVEACGDVRVQSLLRAVPTHEDLGRRGLLTRMLQPDHRPLSSVETTVQAQAYLLGGDRADDLILRLAEILREAFETRRSLNVSELHADLVAAGLIRVVSVVAPSSDAVAVKAVAVLDVCRAPLPERVLDRVLSVPDGAVRSELADLIGARLVLDEGGMLWRPGGSNPVAPSAAGRALRDVLDVLITSPAATHVERVRQVPNVLALAVACSKEDSALVAEAFFPYDKAAKATGDLSTVYRLARVALDAATAAGTVDSLAPEQERRLLWLRGHARICGTSWTLQRVHQAAEAAREMEFARRESALSDSKDNVAFVDKCQGRLSRLQAEDLAADGRHAEADALYDLSRQQLDTAYAAFTALLEVPDYARYVDEPGECLALRARTELSHTRLDPAEAYARRAHAELDHLRPECKAWADACLVDAEIALARARSGMSSTEARTELRAQADRLQEVLDEFKGAATNSALLDVGASEIVARTLQVLAQLMQETGDPDLASTLLKDAAVHFERLDQVRAAYRCRAQALDIDGGLPQELIAALEFAQADDGCRVEAARLHQANPRPGAPARYWRGLVGRGKLTAGNREHPWTDRRTG